MAHDVERQPAPVRGMTIMSLNRRVFDTTSKPCHYRHPESFPLFASFHQRSNLAAVRLGLNKPQPALENAEEALRLDAKYSKGHYRKGQALMALSRPADAAKAFRAGAVLEPQSKLWGPLVQKAVKATETAAAATAAAAETTAPNGSAGSSKPTVSSATTTSAPAVRRTSPAAASTSRVPRETSSNTSKAESTPEVGMKGYKKTADGRMTTYFNNDLSEEAKALIGDIAPKKLDASKEEGAEGTDPAGQSVSAWNKAGTWESRDMTRSVRVETRSDGDSLRWEAFCLNRAVGNVLCLMGM